MEETTIPLDPPESLDFLSLSTSGEGDKAMHGYKRYMMHESSQDKLTNFRHRKSRPAKVCGPSRRELGRTFVSSTDWHHGSRKPGSDDISVSSYSIASRDSPAFSTHRDLIDNMQVMHLDNRNPPFFLETASAARSQSGISSRRSRRSSRTQTTRRKRASLEQVISQTILESAAWGDAHFIVSPQESPSSLGEATTDFILQDLDQAHSVIQSETGSVRSLSNTSVTSFQLSLRSRSLLPPVLSTSAELDTEFRATAGVKSFNTLHTPDTSVETYDAGDSSKRTPVEPASSRDAEESPDPFLDLDNSSESFPTINWSDDSNDLSNRSKTAPDFDRSEGWTPFDANPFKVVAWPVEEGANDDNLEHLSVESPSSIADFGSVQNSFRSKSSDHQDRLSVGARILI